MKREKTISSFKSKRFLIAGLLFLLAGILQVYGFYSSKYSLCISHNTIEINKLFA